MAFVNTQREFDICTKVVTVLLAGHVVWRQSSIDYDSPNGLGYLAYLMATGEVYDKDKHHDELVRLCRALEDSDQGVVCTDNGAYMSSAKAKEMFEANPKLRELALEMRIMFGSTQAS